MARPVPSGTPDRARRYLRPRGRGHLLFASLAAPIVTLAVVFGVYRAGYTAIASPGPVALRHAPIEATCQECHRSAFPHRVESQRCERCHDPRATGRLQLDSHADWTPTSRQVAGRTDAPACASCHTDHRGRLASLRGIETLECARCHQFTGLARHPQFAMVESAKNQSRGLEFSHAVHIDEARRTLGRGCEACHRSTGDLSGFEPTSFDRQCAVCHVKNGVLPVMTDPIAEALVTAPSVVNSPDAIGGLAVRRPGRARIVVSGLTHRDPWVLQNLRILNRGLYTDTDVAERADVEAQLAALERARVAPRASGGAAPVSLAATLSEERVLESAIAAARARLATLTDRLSTPALPPQEAARRTDAILSLVGPCLTCHVLRDGRALAPVTVDTRRLELARFSHAPHVIQLGCEKCHESITTSAKATDVNAPGLDTCRTCHASGQAPSGCLVCHRYHPSADVAFGRPAPARR